MDFLVAKTQGVFQYHGYDYELEPIVPPEVNLRNILLGSPLLNRVICEKNPDTMQTISFDASKLPGYPRKLDMSLEDIPDGSRLMLLRAGGIGDMIMLTPALKKLKQTLGERVTINMSTFADRISLLEGLGYIDTFFPHPIRVRDFMLNADYYLDFSDTKKLFYTSEMIDFHLDCLSFDPAGIPAAEKLPEISKDLSRSGPVKEAIRKLCPDSRLKVLYASKASDKIRYLPPYILELLAGKYPDVCFILPEETTGRYNGRENIFTVDTSGGLNDYVTAIAESDVLVSADSSAYHIAAAVNTPSLVFFGSIGSRIRTGYYPLVIAIDSTYTGLTCHAPCGISALQETPPEIPIGANGIRNLLTGVEITTSAGETFSFDPKKGCPESNATGIAHSPCLMHFSEDDVLAGFEKATGLLGRGRND